MTGRAVTSENFISLGHIFSPFTGSINLLTVASGYLWCASPLKTYEKVGSVAGPGARGVNPGTPLGP